MNPSTEAHPPASQVDGAGVLVAEEVFDAVAHKHMTGLDTAISRFDDSQPENPIPTEVTIRRPPLRRFQLFERLAAEFGDIKRSGYGLAELVQPEL